MEWMEMKTKEEAKQPGEGDLLCLALATVLDGDCRDAIPLGRVLGTCT